jgi:CspA family cold shock protein
VPTGKVKWYDAERGFGFIAGEDGGEVFLHASALPADVKMLDAAPSVVKAKRKPASEMAAIVEDLIKVLDRTGDQLKRGRYPEGDAGRRVATMLRAVADTLDS